MPQRRSTCNKSWENGSFILLPIVCAINAWKSILNSSKLGHERWAVLLGIPRCILGLFIWAAHSLSRYRSDQVFCKAEEGRDDCNLSAPSTECNARRRALCQVLNLVNDTPNSSEKYEFARALAEKLINENRSEGDDTSRGTNTAALESGFLRTVELLTISLQRLHQQREMRKASWYSALCHLVFSMNIGAFQQWLSFEHMSGYLYNVLLQAVSSSKGTTEQSTLQASAIGTTKSHLNATAEKLAQELLWITEKLKDFSSLNRATENWGAQHSLAKLSLSADPHVQAYLLRVSGVFLKELAFSHAMTWNSNLKVSVLLSWLPLFCGAKAGFDYPCLKPSERADFLRNLEEIVMSLSMVDQELVLQCWLREFVSSASEWPNLQDCFEKWYSSVRISTCLPYQA